MNNHDVYEREYSQRISSQMSVPDKIVVGGAEPMFAPKFAPSQHEGKYFK